jgi:uncharacterized protein YbgA (DUF1722 family)
MSEYYLDDFQEHYTSQLFYIVQVKIKTVNLLNNLIHTSVSKVPY